MTEPAVVVAAPAAPAVVAAPTVPAAAPVAVALPVEPVVTPPAPAAPAPANTTDVVEYELTGDAGLDVALAFVGRLGVAADHPAMVATATGDFSLIKAHLATMGDDACGWEQMVALAEQSHTRTETARVALVASVEKAVTDVAGSAENWAAVRAWAAGEATPDEKKQINAMFDTGPVGARAAATLLCEQYAKSKGALVKPASPTANTPAGASTTPANGKLSAREYGTAVRELHKQLGNRMEQSPEYAALRTRLRT